MIKVLLALPILAVTITASAAQTMDHAQHGAHQAQPGAAALPRETGQSAFAAIQEIVALLNADPKTDWSKVDIDALRDHLVDMDELTRNASAESTKTGNGLMIRVSGKDRALRAIQTMVPAHAAELDKIAGWSAQAEIVDGGAKLTVSSTDPAETARIQALGFFGLMATGAHHQEHHWAMATGGSVHAH